ncbi:MAG: PHP domain-containing protein [Acidimicrobiales bacterium]
MIDLHTHSTCSDGTEPPQRVVELAVEAGCGAVALTDHDGLFGIEAAQERATELGIRFVAGCEVSCTADAGPIHLLCYFTSAQHNPLADLLALLRVEREQRNTAILARLDDLGIPLSAEEIHAEARGQVVGRPHFAAALVRRGIVGSIDEAFDRYLARGAPAYVARTPVPPSTVIDDARRSGSVVALAHPLSLALSPAGLETVVSRLAGEGLAGLEAHYARYGAATRRNLVELASRQGLVATGGSDFHGAYRPDIAVGSGTGDLAVPDGCLDELAARVE